jgi:hypothetical protein
VDTVLDQLVAARLWDKEGDNLNPDTPLKRMLQSISRTERFLSLGAIGGRGIQEDSKNPIIINTVALYKDLHLSKLQALDWQPSLLFGHLFPTTEWGPPHPR